ncbi:MAG: hypothetical protein GX986_03025 [Firmicutes bacterium]|nr:hypothetical protein [Bacillota bacterium]
MDGRWLREALEAQRGAGRSLVVLYTPSGSLAALASLVWWEGLRDEA